jgi:CarD family transcriptional regulator
LTRVIVSDNIVNLIKIQICVTIKIQYMEVDYLFEIGDNIVYPMYGVGVIEGIEEKEIQGNSQRYYVINIPTNKLQVFIPTKNITNSHIRSVADKQSMDVVLDIFHYGETDRSLTWKQRYKINTDKVKTGNLKDCAEVVRDLMRIQTEKTLNPSEKTLLDKAKRIFVGELRLIEGITQVQADDLLETCINE